MGFRVTQALNNEEINLIITEIKTAAKQYFTGTITVTYKTVTNQRRRLLATTGQYTEFTLTATSSNAAPLKYDEGQPWVSEKIVNRLSTIGYPSTITKNQVTNTYPTSEGPNIIMIIGIVIALLMLCLCTALCCYCFKNTKEP
jgi:hypothetical protein